MNGVDGVIFSQERLGLPMKNMPMSHYQTSGIATNPAYSSWPQGSSTVDDSWVDRRPGWLDIPPYTHSVQANTEAYPSSLRVPPLIPATRLLDIDEGSDIAHIRDESSLASVPHSLDTMFFSGLSSFAQTPTNSNVFGLASYISNGSPTYVDPGGVDANFNSLQEWVSMNVQGNRYTQPDTISTPWNPEPLIPSQISGPQATVQYQERKISQGLPQQSQKSGKGKGKGPVASSSRRRAVACEAQGLYLCNVCGKPYAQSQGVWRHYRETHKPKLCRHCGIFKWGRRYLYKKHLQERHPTIDLDAALDEAMGAGRRSAITPRFPENKQDFPHPVDDGGVMHPNWPHGWDWPVPAVAKLPISPPAMSLG